MSHLVDGSDGERQLIIAAQAGSDAAWTRLVQAHRQAVFRLAWLLVDDADDAEDIAQAVLVRAHRALGSFDAERPLRPWLLQITRNQAHNWRRSAQRYLAALARWQQTFIEQKTESPSLAHKSAAAADVETLRRAVQRLARTDQEIIYLRYFLELSVAETAETLDIASGTVKSRSARALQRLRTVVQEEFPLLVAEWVLSE